MRPIDKLTLLSAALLGTEGMAAISGTLLSQTLAVSMPPCPACGSTHVYGKPKWERLKCLACNQHFDRPRAKETIVKRIDHDTAFAAIMEADLGNLLGYHYDGEGFTDANLAHALAAACKDQDELDSAIRALSNGWFPVGLWPSNSECLDAVMILQDERIKQIGQGSE